MDAHELLQDNGRTPFPYKLFQMLNDAHEPGGFSHVVSWTPNGRAFKVHDSMAFIKHVAPKYFKQTRYKSFQRQLCLYGFDRVMTGGPLKGSRYHRFFMRGKYELVERIKYIGIKSKAGPQFQATMCNEDSAIAAEQSEIFGNLDYDSVSSTFNSSAPTSLLNGTGSREEYHPSMSASAVGTPRRRSTIQQQRVISPAISPTKSSDNFWSNEESEKGRNAIDVKGLDALGLFEGIEFNLVVDPVHDGDEHHIDRRCIELLDESQTNMMPRQVSYCFDQISHISSKEMREAWQKGYEHAISLQDDFVTTTQNVKTSNAFAFKTHGQPYTIL